MKDNKIMLFVDNGKDKIRKGTYYLEEILPKIFQLFPNLYILHVGNKFEWNVPDKYKNRITQTGKVPHDQMKIYYELADFLVHTSLSEGFPNVLLEAVANKLPVLTSDIEGIDEYFTHKVTAYIFKRGDKVELFQGMMYMVNLSNRELERMGGSAYNNLKVLEKDNYFNKLLDFMEDTLHNNKKKSVNLLEKVNEEWDT